MDPSPVTFQLLALDGGGVRGLFTAAVLAHLEDDLGVQVTDHFDLLAGTSTGGIIALALSFGLRPADLVDFYVSRARTIFRRTWPRLPFAEHLRHLRRAKYDNTALEAALRDVFGEALMRECRVPVVVPTYNLSGDGVRLFKTPHHDRLTRDWKIPIWQVALATSAAPTYLPASTATDHQRLVDGGMWANNPVLVGVAEAVGLLGAPLSGIQALSLGTVAQIGHRAASLDRGGLWAWKRDATDVMLRAQSSGAHGLAQLLLGHGRVHRLDALVPPGVLCLDRLDAPRLQALAAETSQKFAPTFRTHFSPHRPLPYTPRFASEVPA